MKILNTISRRKVIDLSLINRAGLLLEKFQENNNVKY